MAVPQNIESYVKWCGALSFHAMPFGVIDNLVLSKLAYYDFSPLEPVFGQTGMTLEACVRSLGDRACLKGMMPDGGTFLSTCAASRRFGGMRLRRYEETDCDARRIQFCAMEFVLAETVSFIAFRGTDTTLVGWREDFEISYRRVGAQERALEYLRRVVEPGRTYVVGGHSKGANLALYATLLLDEERLRCIQRIFLNDGPGLCAAVIPKRVSRAYARKTLRVLPAHSVVGRLFEPRGIPKVIVESSARGVLQHELLTWELADGNLLCVSRHTQGSDRFAAAFAEWMERVDMAGRKAFVDGLFDALCASGATSIMDVGAGGIDSIEDVVQRLVGAKPSAKLAAVHLPLGVLCGRMADSLRKNGLLMWALTDDAAHNIELLLLGCAFLFAQDDALHALLCAALLVVTVLVAGETLLRVRRRGGEVRGERWRYCVLAVLALLLVTMLVRDDAPYVYGSTVLGIALVAMSVHFATQARRSCGRKSIAALHYVVSVLLGLFAVVVLVAPSHAMDGVTVMLGGLFVIAAILGISSLADEKVA